MHKNYKDLESQVVDNKGIVSDDIWTRFAIRSMAIMPRDDYRAVLMYTLPNGEKTSEYTFTYKNS